jgi:thiol-disulfide isomerase/thioredoxin
LAVILVISPPLARGEEPGCRAPPAELGTFQATEPPRSAPAQPFEGEDGRQRTLTDHRDRGIVLNFWATWCAPCVREMPQLDRLRKLLAGDGIEVLALSEDRAGAPLVRKFYDVNDIKNLEILVDGGGKVMREAKLKGLPTTILIDRRGLEVGRVIGIAEWDAKETVAFLGRCLGR